MRRSWTVSIGDNVINADELSGDQQTFTDEDNAKQFAREKLKRGFGVRAQMPDGQILASSELVAWIMVPRTKLPRTQ